MSTKHKLEPPEFSFQYIINSEMLANRTVEKADRIGPTFLFQ